MAFTYWINDGCTWSMNFVSSRGMDKLLWNNDKISIIFLPDCDLGNSGQNLEFLKMLNLFLNSRGNEWNKISIAKFGSFSGTLTQQHWISWWWLLAAILVVPASSHHPLGASLKPKLQELGYSASVSFFSSVVFLFVFLLRWLLAMFLIPLDAIRILDATAENVQGTMNHG